MRAGGIEPIIEALRGGTPARKENACGTMRNIAIPTESREAIGRAGAAAALVPCLSRECTDGMKEHSSAALWALAAGNTDNRVRIANAGGIEPLVELIKFGNADPIKEHACGALWRISIENKPNQAAIIRAERCRISSRY